MDENIKLVNLLLYGHEKLRESDNYKVTNATLKFIQNTGRF